MKNWRVVLTGIIIFSATPLWAQLSVGTLLETQRGNLPNQSPDDLLTLYSNVYADYRYGIATVGIRYQNFQTDVADATYSQLNQRYIELKKGAFRIRGGNFYTTLGRGLVLRGFELPNIIFEQRQFRKRYSYYRDIDGVLAEARWNRLEITLFSGQPLNNAVPPDFDGLDARFGDMQGGQVIARPLPWWQVGTGYLHTRFSDMDRDYTTVFTRLSADKWLRRQFSFRSSLNLYAEHARLNPSSANDYLQNKRTVPHASYYSVNLGVKRMGLSAEFKDYQHFENYINLPPILFMEHSYYLLNRKSHELLSESEKGYQLEWTWRASSTLFILANTSKAVNRLGLQEFEFIDRMLEVTVHWNDAITSKTFYNWSREDILGEDDRKTAGLNMDWNFSGPWALSLDQEYQRIHNRYYNDTLNPIQNIYTAITLSNAPGFSLSLMMDRTTNPADVDDPATRYIIENNAKNWFSISGAYQVTMNNEISLFYGKRRGGLACTSGTCYEVLPFEGLEIRWIGRFRY